MLRLTWLLFLACLLAEMSLVDAFRHPPRRRVKTRPHDVEVKVKPLFPPEGEDRFWPSFEGDINIGESYGEPFPKFFFYQFRTAASVEELKARLEGVHVIYKLMVRGANLYFIVVENEGVPRQPAFEPPHDATVHVTPLMTMDQFMKLINVEPLREEKLVRFHDEQLILQERWFPEQPGLNKEQVLASLHKIEDLLSQIEPQESCVHFVSPIQMPFKFVTLMKKDKNAVIESFKTVLDIFYGGKLSSYVVEQF